MAAVWIQLCPPTDDQWLNVALAVGLSNVVCIATLLATGLVQWHVPSPCGWRTWAEALLGGFALCLASNLVLDLARVPQDGVEAMWQMCRHPLTGVVTVLIAPVCEEMVFRKVMLGRMRTQGMTMWGALAVQASLFGLVHGNLLQGAAAFLVGLVLGWIYWRTGRLSLCIALHALNNLVSVIVMYQASSVAELSTSLTDTYGTPLVLAAITGLTLLGLGLLSLMPKEAYH